MLPLYGWKLSVAEAEDRAALVTKEKEDLEEEAVPLHGDVIQPVIYLLL